MQMITAIDILSIILSIVALIITIVGFFASLKFYRDGVELQKLANDALTKIEEKTHFIQTQVGGMFERTLDAAIGKKELFNESFAELNDQLEKTRTRIIEETLQQIGAAGEQERKRFAELVDNQLEAVRRKVESTQESVETLASEEFDPQLRAAHHGMQFYGVVENEVFNIAKQFKGQQIPGRLFNLEGVFTLPTFRQVLRDVFISSKSGITHDVDILGESKDEDWIIEIKHNKLVSRSILDQLAFVSMELKAKAWLIVLSNVSKRFKEEAQKRGILLSGFKDLQELKAFFEISSTQ
jgi:hypothetical protein